jgi:hypothetical protein
MKKEKEGTGRKSAGGYRMTFESLVWVREAAVSFPTAGFLAAPAVRLSARFPWAIIDWMHAVNWAFPLITGPAGQVILVVDHDEICFVALRL